MFVLFLFALFCFASCSLFLWGFNVFVILCLLDFARCLLVFARRFAATRAFGLLAVGVCLFEFVCLLVRFILFICLFVCLLSLCLLACCLSLFVCSFACLLACMLTCSLAWFLTYCRIACFLLRYLCMCFCILCCFVFSIF